MPAHSQHFGTALCAGRGILFSLDPILPMSNVQIGPTLVAMSTFSNKSTPVTHTEYYQSTTCAMCSTIYCTHTLAQSVLTTMIFHKSPTFAISNCLRCSANAGGVFNAMHTQKYGRCNYTMKSSCIYYIMSLRTHYN